MADNFRFVETKSTKGVVEMISAFAKHDEVSLNKYIGKVLKAHIEKHEVMNQIYYVPENKD